MEILNEIIQNTLQSFDFAYCITVNILTYLIVQVLSDRRGKVMLSVWAKRGILVGVIAFTGAAYYMTGTDVKNLINSAILAPVFWSWVMKPICKKLKIDYKQLNMFE